MKIQLAQNGPTLDAHKLAQSRALIQASSGGGKSYLLRLMIEQVADIMPSIIIDPEGEFFTVREVCSMVLVGPGGELRADPKSASKVARGLLEQSCSAIIDLSDLPQPQHGPYVAAFVKAIMSAPRRCWRPTLIAIDEAHRFCPEGGRVSEASDAIKDLASRGRKRGYGSILLTQRISKVSKDAVAECANQFFGRTTLDVDIKRSADMLGMSAKQAQVLRSLRAGEWFGHGPALDIDGVGQFMATLPQTEPPKGPGQATKPIKDKSVIQSIADSVEQSLSESDNPLTLEEAEKTICQLREEIEGSALKKRIRELEKQIENPIPAGYTEEQVQEMIHCREEKLVDTVRCAIDSALQYNTLRNPDDIKNPLLPHAESAPAPVHHAPKIANRPWTKSRPSATITDATIPAAQRKVLESIAWYEGIGISRPTTTQIAIMAGFSPSSSHTGNMLSKLMPTGYIERNNGEAWLTEAGRKIVEIPRSTSLAELHATILGLKCINGAPSQVLKWIIDHTTRAGDELTTNEVSEGMNWSTTSSHTGNMLSKLAAIGVIDRSNGVSRTTEILYPRGLK